MNKLLLPGGHIVPYFHKNLDFKGGCGHLIRYLPKSKENSGHF